MMSPSLFCADARTLLQNAARERERAPALCSETPLKATPRFLERTNERARERAKKPDQRRQEEKRREKRSRQNLDG
eukprot:3935433-Rhodomonas_salina.1